MHAQQHSHTSSHALSQAHLSHESQARLAAESQAFLVQHQAQQSTQQAQQQAADYITKVLPKRRFRGLRGRKRPTIEKAQHTGKAWCLRECRGQHSPQIKPKTGLIGQPQEEAVSVSRIPGAWIRATKIPQIDRARLQDSSRTRITSIEAHMSMKIKFQLRRSCLGL